MAKIVLFDKQKYNGEALVLEASIPKLKNTGVNNDVSSLIVIDGTWNLYEHPDYKGDVWTVSATGGPQQDGCYPTFSDWSGTNNSISSVKEVN